MVESHPTATLFPFDIGHVEHIRTEHYGTANRLVGTTLTDTKWLCGRPSGSAGGRCPAISDTHPALEFERPVHEVKVTLTDDTTGEKLWNGQYFSGSKYYEGYPVNE